MSVQTAHYITNDKQGKKVDTFCISVGAAGALAAAGEAKFVLPPSGADGISEGNGWILAAPPLLDVGVNTTHTTSTPLVSATVEKNTDGGTSCLLTIPQITNAAGTGRKTTAATATGITPAVLSATAADYTFADGDAVFVTLLETGATGADPEDVSLRLVFKRQADFDQDFTQA